MKPTKPFNTWLELFNYVNYNSNIIYVRYQMNAETAWGPYPISKIPFADAISYIDSWFVDRIIPEVLEIRKRKNE